ncbi:phage tail protein [Bacillus licheniformis]
MKILAVKDATGVMEPLPGFVTTRTDGSDGARSLKVTGVKTKNNQSGYNLVKNENTLIFDNEEYIIKTHRERTYRKGVGVEVTAIHRIFDDLMNNYIYEEKTGTLRLDAMLSFALAGSGYTFEIDTTDLPISVRVENFGWNNSLALFRDILEKFGAEFDYRGKKIYVAKKFGIQRDDSFLRYKFNVKDPQKEIDTSSFSTYIRGYGKKDEKGNYLFAEYTSPLAEFYGIKHADPVKDERYTDKESLLAAMKKQLNDSMDISLTFTAIELKSMGLSDIKKGDYVWCVIEPFDLNVQLRAVSREDYSDESKSPTFTFGSIGKKASDIIASFNTTKKAVDKVIDTSTGKIKDSAINMNGIATKAELQSHISNTVVHITAEERATWNAASNSLDNLDSITWATPILKNGWVQYPDQSWNYPIQYGKDFVGTVYLRGAISSGTIGNAIPAFTLPVGYRPPFPYLFIGVSSVSPDGIPQYFRGVVTPSGDVCIENSSSAELSNQFIGIYTQFKAV